MKLETCNTLAKYRMGVRSVEKESHAEYYLTGSVEEECSTTEAAEALFSEAASILAADGIQPIQEKAYGLTSRRTEVLAIREKAFRDRGVDASFPMTYIDGRPACGADFAGIQIWGVAPRNGETEIVSIVGDDAMPGRCWTGPGFRMLYFPFIRGATPEGRLPSCATGQAQAMFANAAAALEGQGMPYSRVLRTWIYLARILDWYGEFNRVRTAHHAQEPTFRQNGGEPVFPASTGIQGKCLEGEECFMDLLAVDPGEAIDVRPIRVTSRQGQAFAYGSGFSRGMALSVEGKSTVFVSGTASINPAGTTVYIEDQDAQCTETLLNVASLLRDQGGGLDDICSSTVFCKSREVFDEYKRVTRLLGVPDFPSISVLADVCRPELLVEIEAVAII